MAQHGTAVAGVGTKVKYVDEHGVAHDALVTAVWGTLGESAINVVYVSGDESKIDPHGRQIERAASVSAQGPAVAHGRFYSLA